MTPGPEATPCQSTTAIGVRPGLRPEQQVVEPEVTMPQTAVFGQHLQPCRHVIADLLADRNVLGPEVRTETVQPHRGDVGYRIGELAPGTLGRQPPVVSQRGVRPRGPVQRRRLSEREIGLVGGASPGLVAYRAIRSGKAAD